jgi:UDP-glucose 4-epimerase
MARTIAVTGARGFIGAATVRKLARLPDTKVVALARSRPADATDPNIQWIESSLEALQPSHWHALETTSLDAIVHLAAFTPKSAAERDSAPEIISANVVGLQALIESLRQHRPRRIVFASTLDVYSRSAFDHPVDERSPIGPAGLYGLSKLFGEGLAASWARSAGSEHVTLRIGHVYGPGEDRYAKLVPETIRRLLAGKPARIAGEGTDRRDLLYVDDADEALARSCTAALNGVRTINVARGESYSILDIVNTIADLLGQRGLVEQLPGSTDAYSTVFDTTLMTQVLGAWTFLPLAEGLKQEIAQLREGAG